MDGKPTGHQTAILLREKYTRRISAIKLATDRIQRGEKLTEGEIAALREVGVSEAEIDAMAKSV